MTKAQTVQYRRFLDAGFDPESARMIVERGAWLGTTEMSGGGVTGKSPLNSGAAVGPGGGLFLLNYSTSCVIITLSRLF